MAARKSKPKKKPAKKAAKAKAKKAAPSSSSDWRVETLDRMRKLIFEAEPAVVEEQKWKKPSNNFVGVPVWYRDGIICTGEKYKGAVKLTFAQGAKLPDPAKLFNTGFGG